MDEAVDREASEIDNLGETPEGTKVKKQATAKGKRDSAVQGTNDSSIVSKRSVERTGYQVRSAEGQWLRYFVKKLVRRSPLINLGYFVRVKAVERVVDEKKLVINLGCGFDPLPFVYLSGGADALFIDVDFPDLIHRKCQIIRETPALAQVIRNHNGGATGEMRTQKYCAVGCDLSDLGRFETILREIEPNIDDTPVLFISEVAITYMPLFSANALIAFASKFQKASFAILEQIAPAGLETPFARTMQNHFRKLNTPLLSLPHTSSLRSQAHRFLDAGFVEIETCDLNTFLYGVMEADERVAALNLELFDEYEELSAFLSHYFILVAKNQAVSAYLKPHDTHWQYISWKRDTLLNGNIAPIQESHQSTEIGTSRRLSLDLINDLKPIQRRFAAMASVSDGILIHGGLSNTTRQSTTFCLSLSLNPKQLYSSQQPSARMCHTLTAINEGRAVLIGGREAPSTALDDTWVWSDGWQKVQKIPGGGIYRHATASVGDDKVIVFGGRRGGGQVSSEWLLFSVRNGWQTLNCNGFSPSVWGASLAWGVDGGLLVGGMDEQGICQGDIYSVYFNEDIFTISLKKWTISTHNRSLTRRYGAKIVEWSAYHYLVIGGAGSHHFLRWSDQFILLSPQDETIHTVDVQRLADNEPWLIGHGVSLLRKGGSLIIFGGGGVCFSFGSFWNHYVFVLHRQQAQLPVGWKLSEIPIQIPKSMNKGLPPPRFEPRSIRRVKLETAEQWWEILQASEICILEGLDFGLCTKKWTPQYLKSQVRKDKEVIIHSTDANAMNFLSKNFKYTASTFSDFIDTIFADAGERVYLRALSDDAKNKPARLQDDFPGLAEDFKVPEILCGKGGIPTDRIFSTILRIGGIGSSMWLHYDVMANILTQVIGEKELIVFHPSDIDKLDIPPGVSSSRIPDIFSSDLRNCAHHGVLMPGDAVYIPPLWPHATKPLTPNVGVNVFWKSYNDDFYDRGKDVYGNKDLACYVEGRKALERIVKSFKDVDRDTREFYIKRLASELGNLSK